MRLYITDESNLSRDKLLEFFVYGGLVVRGDESRGMVQQLEQIKSANGIPLDRPIKWANVNWRGNAQLDPTLYAAVKHEMLQIVSASQTKVVIYLAPQDFYHTTRFLSGVFSKPGIDPVKKKKAIEYAINVCMHKYSAFLEGADDYGVVIADDFGDKDLRDHMRKHCFSLYPNGGKYSAFERITYPLLITDEEYSELHQFADVVLGSIQHSLKEITHNFLPQLRGNFWCSNPADPQTILGHGFDVYPKHSSGDLKRNIDALKLKFVRLVSV